MNFVRKKAFLFIIFFIISSILTIFLLGWESFSFNKYLYSGNYDLVSDQLAFKFFINDKWHFPLGKNPNYGIGIGNSIVFSGAVPIISFFSKLFVHILPDNFQFISIWFVICFSLQLFFSYLIIQNLTRNKLYSFISALFFIFCPILLYRIPIHLTLVSHWLILLCLYYEITNNNIIKKEIFYSFIFSLCLLIHFYFLPMILIIKYSFLLQNYVKEKNIKKNIKEILIPIIILLFIAYISGYFEISAFDAMGFGYGHYSFNLAGLFDSQISKDSLDWSFFFSDVPNKSGQTEGFSYLGLGGFLLFIFLLIKFIVTKNKKEYVKLPYILICLICFILSISNIIYFGNSLIFEYSLTKEIYGLLSITRASGRFIWVIYYLIVIFGIISLFKLFKNKKIPVIIISFILILQIVDIYPALKKYTNANIFNKSQINTANPNFWKIISEDFEIIRTTYYKNSSNVFPLISNQILKNKFLKTDVARLGRFDRRKASQNRNRLYRDLNNKLINNNTAYVIDNINHLRYLKYLYKSENVGFFFVDGVWLMLPSYKKKMNKDDFNKFNKIKIVEIKENQKHIFKKNGLENPLGFGWTFSKKIDGIWTEGSELNILFNFKAKMNKTYNVRLNLKSSIAKKNEELKGFIRIGDKKIKSFRFDNLSTGFLEFPIPNYLNEVYKIDIVIDNPLSPLDLLQSPDGRLLGLLIESIEII